GSHRPPGIRAGRHIMECGESIARLHRDGHRVDGEQGPVLLLCDQLSGGCSALYHSYERLMDVLTKSLISEWFSQGWEIFTPSENQVPQAGVSHDRPFPFRHPSASAS